MYSTFIAYLLWFLSCFGIFGFHRFYLGKTATAILWFFTGGGFLVGTIYDFFTLPDQVKEANFRKALFNKNNVHNNERGPNRNVPRENWRYAEDAQYKVVHGGREKKEHPERIILKLAKENSGVLTVSDVALAADIPVEEAKKYLEALVSKGFAELRVRKSGSLVYVIPDMADKDEPLEDI
jgi:predicted transcriptional regulator